MKVLLCLVVGKGREGEAGRGAYNNLKLENVFESFEELPRTAIGNFFWAHNQNVRSMVEWVIAFSTTS